MNRKQAIALGFSALVTLSAPQLAIGQGVPTVDLTSIARLGEILTQARSQLQEQVQQNLKLDEQTQRLIAQLQELLSIRDALRNGLTLADLGFDPETFLRQIMPGFSDLTRSLNAARTGDWQSVMASGSPMSGQGIMAHVERAMGSGGLTRGRVDELAESEDAASARIGTSANVNVFMSVAAESSSEAARESLTRIDGLVGKIEGTVNLKQAIDLNTRVTAELGIALANVWAMQAVQTVGMGQAGIMDAATAADEEKYLKIQMDQ